MRIAVLRPQVPFARGGAEIFTDELVDELRARATRGGPRLGAVPCIPAPASSRRRSSGGCSTSRRRRGAGSTSSSERSSRRTSSTRRRVWLVHQFRQAYELDGTDLGRFGPSPGIVRSAGGCRSSTGSPSRGRRACSRPPRTSPKARARPAFHAEVLPSAPGAAVPHRAVRGIRALRQPPRPGEADRSPPRGGCGHAGFDVVVASDGPDRERLESVADGGLDGRVRFEGRVSAGGSPSSTRRARRSSTRPWTRTSAWGRTRRSSRASP